MRLVTGIAEVGDGEELPYNVVLKIQKKWNRYGDPDSWRREYDLYASDLDEVFTDAFRWPKCYHAEINNDNTQIWMEYVEGVSGLDMTVEMYEHAAEELGRFQGRIYVEKYVVLQSLSNLSEVDLVKKTYLHYKTWKEVYDYIRYDNCEIPKHICNMLIDVDDNSDEIWLRIEKLPIVFCHRDFWITNIFCIDKKIRLIDWDTTGWGYMGEDIASLIADETEIDYMVECYHKCIPAYYKGFSEYADISHISDNCVRELILVMFGYRLIEGYKYAQSPDEKELHLNTLQKIYDMGL
ncbi:aminoglycoside phosphotransferase family protein [Vallitalea okinawensis]|uniref:aminoglycoside phosphotransferase family protein n=1 Tax=Vallitalea okinawensis TaxID=2078660 RepID=UPI001FA847E9|nr:aminoglycoside phosphotransferase family protein [Vallitalea okinawensis]